MPQHVVSAAFWRSVSEVPGELPVVGRTAISALPQNLDYLWRFVSYVGPDRVIEIGSGASTVVIWDAMARKGSLDTCSRVESLVEVPSGVRHHLCESGVMLGMLTEPADLFFFDGRLHREDVEHVRRLTGPDTVYLFDDFHGCEKGVMNAFALQDKRFLMVPCDGPVGRSTLAAMLPASAMRYGVYA